MTEHSPAATRAPRHSEVLHVKPDRHGLQPAAPDGCSSWQLAGPPAGAVDRSRPWVDPPSTSAAIIGQIWHVDTGIYV